ncbi:MAG: homoserine kinase [Defluviitaleaceae bacterium]|nr:homoserine kinase [Defluviitaleaceae bacterium]
MITVRVPATTANLGAGFDSLGMALSLYNRVSAQFSPALYIEIQNNSANMPTNTENLIYKSMVHFYREFGKHMPAVSIVQKDEIPISSGLGSSAACIVAGIMLANKLSGKNLPIDALLQIAERLDGQPDNVAPALLGGIVSSARRARKPLVFSKIPVSSEITFVIITPELPPKTEEAAKVATKVLPLAQRKKEPELPPKTEGAKVALPAQYKKEDVLHNISRSALFIASMVNGEWDNLATAVQDKIHQPYREKQFPHMQQLFVTAYYHGAKAVFLSGDGPSAIAIVKKENSPNFEEALMKSIKKLGKWSLTTIDADNEGATYEETETPQPQEQ